MGRGLLIQPLKSLSMISSNNRSAMSPATGASCSAVNKTITKLHGDKGGHRRCDASPQADVGFRSVAAILAMGRHSLARARPYRDALLYRVFSLRRQHGRKVCGQLAVVSLLEVRHAFVFLLE